ncbi:hypothetical protein PoB_002793200 [Plakobranchus ocellatus]|uniref:Secreted protein n=1 Tax=Plakobranchus ocellatus TaxID=259542 RepID=A0AAV4A3H6_9GAST|nr:hypothetical protein PoB_002793200 [Plakobranchus ocellatus]
MILDRDFSFILLLIAIIFLLTEQFYILWCCCSGRSLLSLSLGQLMSPNVWVTLDDLIPFRQHPFVLFRPQRARLELCASRPSGGASSSGAFCRVKMSLAVKMDDWMGWLL